MGKQIFPRLALAVAALMVAGCTSANTSGGAVETRAYVDNRNRVDQSMEGGNYGYISGTPKAPDRSNFSKTRQVYTLEFTKNPGVTPEELRKPVPPAQPVPLNIPAREERSSYSEPEPVNLPPMNNARSEEPAVTSESTTEYVVEKGDTLQKISKKFYGGYSKWTKIYEANKDILPNPNKIKPGLTIRIPQ